MKPTFNRTRVECKSLIGGYKLNPSITFNRTRVECKLL